MHCISFSFSASLHACIVQRGIPLPTSGGEVVQSYCRPYVSAEKHFAVAIEMMRILKSAALTSICWPLLYIIGGPGGKAGVMIVDGNL